jgi:glycosyltransferase involved in cell wall biosynthesis
MKKLFVPLSIIALILICFFSFSFFSKQAKVAAKKKAKAEKIARERIFPVIESKPFVVVIPSYNNERICHRNLQSVFDQTYKNFRIIYIDDCSTDQTHEKVKSLFDSHPERSATLIKNEKNLGALENLYRAIISCKDEEIIVILDGDDWLAHDLVLEKLNAFYANPDIWMTYGSYLYYPSYGKGECSRPFPQEVFKQKTLREYCREKGTIVSHLKSFYAGLFKQIKLEDLLHAGNFFNSTADGAIGLPLTEMARDHLKFIPEVFYINNRANPLNDDKVNFEKQQTCWHEMLSMKPYEKLPYLDFPLENKKYTADLVVFSYDRPMQLYAYLESLQKYVEGIGKVCVIYRTTHENYSNAYDLVKQTFPEVVFCKQSDTPHADFKPLVMQEAFSGPSAHLLFAVDDIIIKDFIDLNGAIRALELTQAKGFYLRLGTHVDYCYTVDQNQGIPPLIPLKNKIYAWQFKEGKGDWCYPHSLDMTLYKKDVIQPELLKLSFKTPNELESEWAKKAKKKQIGLCYEVSKIVNVPENLVNQSSNRHRNGHSPEELLSLFNEGLKIDISDFYQIENHSVHIEHPLTFVSR